MCSRAGRCSRAPTGWPTIGLNANFRLDGLALMFGLLITGIGLLDHPVRAPGTSSPRIRPASSSALMMLFMAAMLGIVLSDNLLLLVVFWELTSVSSFLLVGYWGHKAEARAGARMALAVTGGGGLALLAGVVLLGQIAGSYDLSAMLERGAADPCADARYPARAGADPARLLHQERAVAVPLLAARGDGRADAGFGLPALGHHGEGRHLPARAALPGARRQPGCSRRIVATVGLVTMVFAAYVAVFKHDLKGLLAYSTISHLGLITFLIGLATPLSAVAAVFHILNHATFKASLFMTAGIIDHETGTRDMRQLGGLMKVHALDGDAGDDRGRVDGRRAAGQRLPVQGDVLHRGGRRAARLGLGRAGAAGGALGGICSVAYSLRFIHDVFFNGPPKDLPNPHPHEPPLVMKAPVALLVVLCVVVGMRRR